MPEDSKYTHISVSTDDDDDFVIQAGEAIESDVLSHAGDGLRHVDGDSASAAVEPSAEEGDASSPAFATEEALSYRATTIEDLEGSKMSSMQKGVIAAAVVLIVAFVVWYIVLR